jgi:glutathione S-transferase
MCATAALGDFNKFAGKAYEHKRPRDLYGTESSRLLGVRDERLAGRDWVMGADYSIADISVLRLFSGFHIAMTIAAVTCVLATLAVFIIEPGPTSTSSRETDPFGVRNQQAGEAGRKQ